MQIDQDLCIACGQCPPYCPVEAITLDDTAEIDLEECAECGCCLRCADCPVDAIFQQDLSYPRSVRSILSDPLTIAAESGISGRGTEEMKTNEVTGRFKSGQVGIGIEVGRPVTGARFRDVEKIAQAVAASGVEFETVNPTTSLMSDPSSGKFKEELLDERAISAILEFSVSLESLPDVLEKLKNVEGKVDCVFTVCVACKADEDENVPVYDYLNEAGVWYAPNGKTNVGLGRPLVKEA
ncbi:MAG: 4Fe-4S binding protein [Desulfohalobiaceae bacterium]|nr:4Fe-4S binding protein [Desulfohalobiaceae bacterium]